MKILVTGGAGFIGRHLVRALCEEHGSEEPSGERHSVVVLDNLSSESSSKDIDKRAKLIVGDIRDAEDVKRTMKGCQAVFHLAAVASVSASDDLVYKTNFIGSRNVFEQAVKQKAKIVFTSSAAVYGSISLPHKESVRCVPVSMYGKTKLKAEFLLSDAEPKPFIARLFNVYGPEGHGVVNIFCRKIPEYEPVTIYGSGRQTRDFVHVDDVVRILVSGLDSEGTYNVGTGKETGVIELTDLVFEMTKNKPEMKFSMPHAGDLQRSVADISRIKSKDWAPRINIRDGLKMLLEGKLAK